MDFIAGGSKIQSVSEEHGCAHCKYTRKDVIRKFLAFISEGCVDVSLKLCLCNLFTKSRFRS